MEPMYRGIPFSPQTTLTATIGAADTVIPVADVSAFPDPPNYATIGIDADGETISYAAKTDNALSGCTRGVEGTPKSWASGSVIARNFTAKDLESLQKNLREVGRGAQSDWGVNDETNFAYVRGRTHWVERIGGDDIVPEQIVNITTSGRGSASDFGETLVVGDKYDVVVDGVMYICVAKEHEGELVLGNTTLIGGPDWGSGEDTGEPFAFTQSRNGGPFNVWAEAGFARELTVSVVTARSVVYHKFDLGYLPDGVPYVQTAAVGQTVVVSEVDAEGKPTKWEAADVGTGGGASVKLDTTLSVAGRAADAKAVGDALGKKQPSGDYALRSELPSVPVKSVNGKTGAVSLSASDVGARPDTWTPTAGDVGADPAGTASRAVSGHNVSDTAHNDIRELIGGLTTRLNALANSDDTTLDQMAELVAYIKANRGLIDSITTGKVSVSDIVDNLTTNVKNKPLSAAQGVALKGLIDRLSSGKLDAAAVADWAKAASKPSYSASEVGADPSGTAASAVSAHNQDDKAHQDIRKQIGQLANEKADLSEVDDLTAEVDDLKANGVQQVPLFANSVEECTDTAKMYVLPDGYLYAYKEVVTLGGAGYTNLVPTSVDTDGSIYNGTGYKDNARLSSSGGVSGTAQAGSVTTGFIPYTPGAVIRMKGAEWVNATANYTGHFYINFYDSGKTFKTGMSSSGIDNYTGNLTVSYDAATGITTFDTTKSLTDTSTVSQTMRSCAFIRINAYGKGADLIVTVNEEIKEAGPTVSYQWVNTGHAFVPADYEQQIVDLERRVEEHEEAVNDLEKQVGDILDGNTQIAANTKFDPTVYDLPVLYLEGDTAPIAVSKDNKVTLNYTYNGRSGTCTLKGQGATSYKTAQALVNAGKKGKFNYTINFDTKFEAKEGWGSQKKYCLKANFIDTTHSRNICSCKLWGMSVKARSVVPSEMAILPNGGAVDGFPIVIMLNGEFHGLYTWNIPKDGWMFGLVEDTTKTQAIVGADDHTTATQMKEASMSGFEVEFVSDEDNADWVTTSLTRMISAVINSNGSDLDTTVAQYLDLDSVIDHYIHTVVDKATDCVDKNYLLVTFDGTKWYMSEYDRDSIHGLNWDASGTTRPVSNVSFAECAETVKIYELIKRFKAAALKARYKELRGNVLSESRIMQTFENFAWAIPSPVMVEDVKLYPTIKGSGVNTIDQIGRFVRQRLETCDKWMEEL